MVASLTDEEYQAARARGQAVGPRAVSARYNVRTKRLEVELDNGMGVTVPAVMLQGLQNATAKQLRQVEIRGGGIGLHWEELDADVYVPTLFQRILGAPRWMAELGRAGGRARSEKKAAAARANGAKGGRPRKRRG